MDYSAQEHIRNLRDLYDEEGLAEVRSMVALMPIQDRAAGDALIKEFEEKERDTETLKLARDANHISREANRFAKIAMVVSTVAVGVSVLLAIAT